MSENKITLQEHVDLGNTLKVLSTKLGGKYCEITPKINARKSREAKALKIVNQLRSILDDIMLENYGKVGDNLFSNPNWWQDIYYGTAGRIPENY